MSRTDENVVMSPPEQGRPAKQKKKKSGLLGRIIRRFLLVLLTLVILIVAGLWMLLDTIFHGPSEAAVEVLTMTLLEPSGTKWVPGLFLSDEEIQAILDKGAAELPDDVTDTSKVVINKDSAASQTDEWKEYPDGIRIEKYAGDTFNAYIMIIRDPSQVYMATSTSGNYSRSVPGTRITDAIETEGAIAAINAGAFFDNGTSSSEVGSTPEGLVIAGGEVRWNSGSAPEQGFVGFTEDNILVVAKTMTAAQAKDLNVRDGCEFGPVLIMNGEVNQEAYNSASGWNPRTCIGQRSDGAVIFLCIDGRQPGSIGGTYKDCIDIMMEYGAVNACNLDGGSSSVMLYRDAYGLYGDAGQVQMINSYSLLQSEPRRMPTFWMVRPAEEG